MKAAVAKNEAVSKAQFDKRIEKISNDINHLNLSVVLYDKDSNSVTFGGDKTTAPGALHNVQASTIAEGSHDAIDGSQIEKISQDVANIFGGNAEFSEGILFGPLYHLSHISEDGTSKDRPFYDVGSALTGLDENINNVNSRLTHVTNEFTQKIDGVSKDSLLWSNDEQAFIVQHGEGKTNSKIKSLPMETFLLTQWMQ
ncbi:hypothetical protein ME9_00433 [Bartonella taylorii 8TBB]|uniref:Uncharacterized protein n=1 Tax=Bartonella taylorii 8TBB TaxID=1094560 RepID=A0A9P2S0U3_BARTA|nr:hypothetical protein ME9_00433 [Bartonella taylorii 8TBB]